MSSNSPNTRYDYLYERLIHQGGWFQCVYEIVPILSPDGHAWGRIPDCLAPYLSTQDVPAGEIVIPEGSRSEGLTHIIDKHIGKIETLHPQLSLDAYLHDVLRHFQRIFRQSDGSLWLIRTNGTTKCAVVAPISVDGVLVYKLITAYPLPREPNYAKRGAVRLVYAK